MNYVTLQVGVTSITYSNIGTINSMWHSPLHPTSDGSAGAFVFLCTFYRRIKNTDFAARFYIPSQQISGVYLMFIGPCIIAIVDE